MLCKVIPRLSFLLTFSIVAASAESIKIERNESRRCKWEKLRGREGLTIPEQRINGIIYRRFDVILQASTFANTNY